MPKYTTKKVKIFFFSKGTLGGTGTFLNQIRLLSPKKFKIQFYLFKEEKDFRLKHRHNNFLKLKDYPKHRYPSPSKGVILIKYFLYVHKIINQEKPDIVFACDLYPFIILSLLKFLGIQINLYYFINIDIFKQIRKKPNTIYRVILASLSKILLKEVDCVIFPSKDLMKGFIRENKIILRNSIIIHYGIKPSGLINRFKTKKKLFEIVSIGRLDSQKDFPTILKAFKVVRTTIDNVRLLIIGDGELKNTLIKEAENLKIKKHVSFLGWRQNVYSYLEKSDLLLFASYYEGFGMTILEAMVCGLPVISTDTPYGPSEILEKGKYGILIPTGDHKKMAEQAIKLLQIDSLRKRYSKLSFLRANAFSMDKMLSKYENLLLNSKKI